MSSAYSIRKTGYFHFLVAYFCIHLSVSIGDRVIFAESPGAPGVPIVYRTPDERSANPDRLNLDR